MAAYLDYRHHPQHALPPRTAWLATTGAEVVGYVGGHVSRRFNCEGELQYLYVVPPPCRVAAAAGGLILRAELPFAAAIVDRLELSTIR